jgi:hypothetical protein
MGWILAEYTEGAIPATLLETSPETGWSPDQWADWLQMLNEQLGGSTQERMKFRMLPPGAKAVQTTDIPERYKPEYDMFLVKLIAGDFGLTATELGFPEVGSLGASFHEGEEDVLNRVTRTPDCKWLAGIATELMVRHLGMPNVLRVQILGLESEDEAAADAVASTRVNEGRMTRNEDRARMGLPALPDREAGMAMITLSREIIPLAGAADRAAATQAALTGGADRAPGQDPGPGGRPAGPPSGTGQQQGKPGSADQGKQKDAAKALPDGPGPAPASDPSGAGSAGEAPGSSAAELVAYRRWSRKGGQRGQFTCNVLAKADAPPEMAADDRVVFREPERDPKALSPGLAGTGTRS